MNDAPRRFVLHDHRKPRPHFDLRLEEDGVLRSWGVARGLPDSPGDTFTVKCYWDPASAGSRVAKATARLEGALDQARRGLEGALDAAQQDDALLQ